jgi:hypothetical protein
MSGHCESLNVAFARKKFSKIENEQTKNVSIKKFFRQIEILGQCAPFICANLAIIIFLHDDLFTIFNAFE